MKLTAFQYIPWKTDAYYVLAYTRNEMLVVLHGIFLLFFFISLQPGQIRNPKPCTSLAYLLFYIFYWLLAMGSLVLLSRGWYGFLVLIWRSCVDWTSKIWSIIIIIISTSNCWNCESMAIIQHFCSNFCQFRFCFQHSSNLMCEFISGSVTARVFVQK